MHSTEHARIIRIQKNFASTMQVLECLVDASNPIQSMIVSGAPGIGKSWNICKRLQELHDTAEINYSYLNGKCSTGGLYEALYNARSKYSVLLLDDVEVFDSDDKMNLLKAALDTGESRKISWMSRTQTTLPKQFEFKGAVVFITNVNLAQQALGSSGTAQHTKAVLSRSIFIDLEIHDAESIKAHVLNVLSTSPICTRLGCTPEEQTEVLNFIAKYGEHIPNLSLRTPVLMSGIIKKYKNEWESICLQRLVQQ